MKLHLCCGDVYLDGYVNIDVDGEPPTKDNHTPTTLDKYYLDKKINNSSKPVVDSVSNVFGLDYDNYSVDEIVMISAFEHFTKQKARHLVKSFYKMLKLGGKFKFDFPDIKKTAKKFDDEYMIRLIYGSKKNEYAVHKWGYTKNSIKELVKVCKWKSIEFGDIVKHDYPMIGVTLTK